MNRLQKSFPTKSAQYTALIALCVVSLPLLLQLPVLLIAIFLFTLFARFILVSLNVVALKIWQTILAIVLMASLVYFNLNTLVGRDGGIALLLFLALLKSFEGGTIRDWQVLLLASLFLVIGPLLFDQGILSGLWMALSLWAILVALANVNQVRLKDAAKQASFALVLTLPLMGVLFIATPRLPEPLWKMPQENNSSVSGLSETLDPGSVAELIQSNALAFNAVFNDRTPSKSEMYWRMMVMGEFNGTSWQATPSRYPNTANPVNNNSISYTMTLVDQNGRIPAMDYPVSVDSQTEKRIGATVSAKQSYAQLRRVTLQSSVSDRLPEDLDSGQIYHYSQLTRNNYQTQELAKKLASESQNSEAFIQKSLQFIADNGFKYTLTPPTLNHSPNQIDTFLFQTKQGFCEHYASAFAFMMRSGGLPSRVVTGYQGGTYYPDGNFWQVRSKEAHAWVEVWLPETKEWLRVDPTSVVSDSRINGGIEEALPLETGLQNQTGFWHELEQKSQFQWQQWVVGFDESKQSLLFSWLGLNRVNGFTILLVILVGGLLTTMPIYLWWRKVSRQQFNPLSQGFLLLKEKILPGNWAATTSMGPLELLEFVKENDSEATFKKLKPLIDELIRLHYEHPNSSKQRIWSWYAKAKAFKYKDY